MRYLVLLLRIFITAFGLSQPKPDQEQKVAVFLFGTLSILALLVAAAVWLLLHLTL